MIVAELVPYGPGTIATALFFMVIVPLYGWLR